MRDADVFIGVSGPDLISQEMLASMAPRPVVFALSNPVPEIRPEVAFRIRNDMVMATGRSDYPNQVNNVLGFPFIFRGALDVRASRINEDVQIATVNALRALPTRRYRGRYWMRTAWNVWNSTRITSFPNRSTRA